jgi:putative tryptophan/tyrosine transport system substrate-binding protein
VIGRRRALQVLAGLSVLVTGRLAAQSKPRIGRVGYLHHYTIEKKPTPERAAFLAGLREAGWEVGRNLVIEYRGAEGDVSRLTELAEELIKARVDVMVAGSAEEAAAAKRVTSTIPIVVIAAGDPVHEGLIKSYARPGGNVTGLSFISPELGAKRIELVKEILPRTKRIAIIWNARDSAAEREWTQAREAAQRIGIDVDPEPMREAADLARTLDRLPKDRPDAILVIVDARMIGFRKIIADAALKHRIACIAGWRGYVESGAIASYAPEFRALFHRAAYYVDRILKGAKAQDLPVEQPSKFELVVNVKTAAAIGIAIPKAVLLRADEVIE